jgi:hypothetical protein
LVEALGGGKYQDGIYLKLAGEVFDDLLDKIILEAEVLGRLT